MKKKDKKKKKKISEAAAPEKTEIKIEDFSIEGAKDNAEKPAPKEEAQPKRTIAAVEKFNMYKFIFKILAFAILITFAVLMWIFQEEAIGAIYLISGIFVAFAAVIRVIPLLRTLKTNRARLISFCEIVLHLIIGAYLIGVSFYHWGKISEVDSINELTGFAKFNLDAYKYILVFLLYTRAICYFWVTILYHEQTDKVRFWLHVATITIAVVIAALPLTPNKVVWTLIILAFLCAAVIGGEAGTGYYRYRKSAAAPKKKEKQKKKDKKKGIEAPAREDSVDISDIDPNIIPIEDNNPQDSNIIS